MYLFKRQSNRERAHRPSGRWCTPQAAATASLGQEPGIPLGSPAWQKSKRLGHPPLSLQAHTSAGRSIRSGAAASPWCSNTGCRHCATAPPRSSPLPRLRKGTGRGRKRVGPRSSGRHADARWAACPAPQPLPERRASGPQTRPAAPGPSSAGVRKHEGRHGTHTAIKVSTSSAPR